MMPDDKLWALLHDLSRDVASVRAEVESVRREVVEMRENHIREAARRDALAEQDAAVRALPERVAELERGHRPALQDADVRGWHCHQSAGRCAGCLRELKTLCGLDAPAWRR